jgi:hypothetical protein
MMKTIALFLLLVIGGGLVSGCMIDPWGGHGGHHEHHDRYATVRTGSVMIM